MVIPSSSFLFIQLTFPPREVTHDIRDLQEACLDPARFLESSMVEPMAGCSCPIMIDFAESDIRLCLDDMINEICQKIQQ